MTARRSPTNPVVTIYNARAKDGLRLPLSIKEVSETPAWHKLITINVTANTYDHDTLGDEPPKLIRHIRKSNYSDLDKMYQWCASKAFFPTIRREIQQTIRWQKTLVLLINIFFLILGGLVSHRLLSGQLTIDSMVYVNVVWWFIAFLGLPLLTMLAWIIIIPFPLHSGMLGHWFLEGSRLFFNKHYLKSASDQPIRHQVLSALYKLISNLPVSKWYLSSKVHVFWLYYIIGGTVMLTLMLSFRHYEFMWQTTWLNTDFFIQLIQILSYLPSLVGFDTPNTQQIIASQWQGTSPATTENSQNWASFMIGCGLIYGIIPRAILWFLSHSVLATLLARSKPNPANPVYGPYMDLLVPAMDSEIERRLQQIDAQDRDPISRPFGASTGKIYWIRYESLSDFTFSLRELHEASVLLTDIDDIDSHDIAIDESRRTNPEQVLCIILAVNIFQVPDQGFQDFLYRLLQASSVRVLVYLCGAAQMQVYGESEDIPERVKSWREAASNAHLHPEDCIFLNDHERTGNLSETSDLQSRLAQRLSDAHTTSKQNNSTSSHD